MKKIKVRCSFRGRVPFIGRCPAEGVEIDENQFALLNNLGYNVTAMEETLEAAVLSAPQPAALEEISAVVGESNLLVSEVQLEQPAEVIEQIVEPIEEADLKEGNTEVAFNVETASLEELKAEFVSRFPKETIPPMAGKKWFIKKLG